MTLIAIAVAIQLIVSSYDAINKKICGGQLTTWIVLGVKAIWTKMPNFMKLIKEEYVRHFRAMKKYAVTDIKPERLTNKMKILLYVYLSVVTYLVCGLIGIYTIGAFMTEFSLLSLSIGISAGVAFFMIAEFYRADAYNKAIESRVNLFPWKRMRQV